MLSNLIYKSARDCPTVIPLFPLPEALLLPRAHIPLNIFEPRYLMMIDDALKAERMIGVIQPHVDKGSSPLLPALYHIGCLGRITQFAETGDGRYHVTLTGITRFEIVQELLSTTLYRQAQVDYSAYEADFISHAGEDDVDSSAVLKSLRRFAEIHEIEIDWKSVKSAPIEALVNALAMMSPYGAREKQALLEIPHLKERAELLIALTEIEEARNTSTQGESNGLQ